MRARLRQGCLGSYNFENEMREGSNEPILLIARILNGKGTLTTLFIIAWFNKKKNNADIKVEFSPIVKWYCFPM